MFKMKTETKRLKCEKKVMKVICSETFLDFKFSMFQNSIKNYHKNLQEKVTESRNDENLFKIISWKLVVKIGNNFLVCTFS